MTNTTVIGRIYVKDLGIITIKTPAKIFFVYHENGFYTFDGCKKPCESLSEAVRKARRNKQPQA